MSRNSGQKPEERASNKMKRGQQPDAGRRRLLWIGAGAATVTGLALTGIYASREKSAAPPPPRRPQQQSGGASLPPVQLTPNAENALRAGEEMLAHYTRDLNNASAIIHAVRGFGRNFRIADGTNAVDHLCLRYAADREVNGKRYPYFKRDAEVHENSFLKTFLEAGVGLDHPVTVGDRRYTLQDIADGGKALFRCDPSDLYKYDAASFRYDLTYTPPPRPVTEGPLEIHGDLLHEHLPWGIIAFSILDKPGAAQWTNAFGEKIDFRTVVDKSLAEYETTCSLGEQEIMRGGASPDAFRAAVKNYSCFGLHTVYSYLVAIRYGYTQDDLPGRMKRMIDLLTWRLRSDAEAINSEYAKEAAGAAPYLVDAFSTRALLKLYGHAFEAIEYARLHKLMTFTPAQERRMDAGRQAMYESLVRLRGMDWAGLRRTLGDKFISDIVIALGHAVRAMKLPTAQNPDAGPLLS